MCGICGKIDFGGAPVDRELVASMCATIVHRGPDDEGIYTAPYVGLGQRRLSIIDLAHSATAPLSNEDGTVWVTFNGEIYNFRELRMRLERRGHTFRTNTDTEVIVHLYEEHGVDAVRHMRGMFAFALWDAKAKRLFAARDRLGKKPFVYARTASSFVFGSEIKAITADPSISVAPNWRAIDRYLTYQYVPSPDTAFAGIEKLPAGHFLVCDAVSREVKVERYWAPPAAEKTRATREEIAAELVGRLREAVRMRLVSDVPLGAFLSGGIDSSAVVALMAQESGAPVKTFTIGFEDDAFDERDYARLVANRYGTEHHEFIVRPDAAEVLPLLVRHYNEPFADSSALPTYYLSKVTRQHVTVALSGDGGDENFAGYNNYAAAMAWGKADVVPAPVRRAAGRALAATLDALPYTNTTARASRAAAMVASDLPERFRLQSAIFKAQEKALAYTPQFRALIGESETLDLQWSAGMDALDWMMRHDQTYYLADCLMVKVDVASMANSLEVRAPLLDHELVEFTATIPSAMKRDSGGGKQIFKDAVRRLLPEEILTKRKSGFGVPLARWMRGELAPLVEVTLLDERAARRGLFEPKFVRRMVDEHRRGDRDWSNRIWALLFLELWFRELID
jgi:asparagine synthase (glutamine-hydrolysing)